MNFYTDNYPEQETSKMLKELGFNEQCYGFHAPHEGKHYILDSLKCKNNGVVVTAPLWQQIKKWLWDKHKINIEQNLFYGNQKEFGFNIYTEVFDDGNSVWHFRHKFETSNPIAAEKEAIKQAVKYLHEQIKK